MIGMDMRIDDVLQPEATLAQQGLVWLRLNRRINNRRLVRAARGNDVRSTPTAFVQELFEVHDDDSGFLIGFARFPPLRPKFRTVARPNACRLSYRLRWSGETGYCRMSRNVQYE